MKRSQYTCIVQCFLNFLVEINDWHFPVGVNSWGYILRDFCPILLLRHRRFCSLNVHNWKSLLSLWWVNSIPSVGCPSSDIAKVFYLFYTTYVKEKGDSHLSCFSRFEPINKKFNPPRQWLQHWGHNKLEFPHSASDDILLAGESTLRRRNQTSMF